MRRIVLTLEEEEEEEDEDEDQKPKAAKRRRRQEEDEERETTTLPPTTTEIISSSSEEAKEKRTASASASASTSSSSSSSSCRIASGIMSKIPAEIFPHILKFLSSEDLIACSLVCRFLNNAASDESLWRRLSRDEEDMGELVRNCPSEFKEYYIQMQAAKRTQPPLPSQVIDDRVILDKTVADQVSIWKSSRGLTDKVVMDHTCSGETCSYYQIGDVFVCEKTGHVHVCDDTCREVVMDPANELLVCTISGHCFDRLLSPAEMEPDNAREQGSFAREKLVSGGTILEEVVRSSFGIRVSRGLDEGSLVYGKLFWRVFDFRAGFSAWHSIWNSNKAVLQTRQNHLWDLAASISRNAMLVNLAARAYLLGYNCADEKELEAALRAMVSPPDPPHLVCCLVLEFDDRLKAVVWLGDRSGIL
ncbi:hypothetical protein TIFTF001_029475 [Ficus carica]|uniref:F-box domain-containing protein n=1 Tax=Ficus carica TaxID=3494 RepID=A0AA88DSH0_FICCA|nr:hypothetical protein TIFTF001_029475 [Ficus carica]